MITLTCNDTDHRAARILALLNASETHKKVDFQSTPNTLFLETVDTIVQDEYDIIRYVATRRPRKFLLGITKSEKILTNNMIEYLFEKLDPLLTALYSSAQGLEMDGQEENNENVLKSLRYEFMYLEKILGSKRYLTGSNTTAADILIAASLLCPLKGYFKQYFGHDFEKLSFWLEKVSIRFRFSDLPYCFRTLKRANKQDNQRLIHQRNHSMGDGFRSERLHRNTKTVPSLDFGALRSPKTVKESAFEDESDTELVSIPKSSLQEIEKRLSKLEDFQKKSQLNTERTIQNLPKFTSMEFQEDKPSSTPSKNVKFSKKITFQNREIFRKVVPKHNQTLVNHTYKTVDLKLLNLFYLFKAFKTDDKMVEMVKEYSKGHRISLFKLTLLKSPESSKETLSTIFKEVKPVQANFLEGRYLVAGSKSGFVEGLLQLNYPSFDKEIFEVERIKLDNLKDIEEVCMIVKRILNNRQIVKKI